MPNASALLAFRQQLRTPQHSFSDSLAFIDRHYCYQPQAFRNGTLDNAAGQNPGSCKILALALLEGLSDEEALLAFGEHYRQLDQDPNGTGHANIRALRSSGLGAVYFTAPALTRRV